MAIIDLHIGFVVDTTAFVAFLVWYCQLVSMESLSHRRHQLNFEEQVGKQQFVVSPRHRNPEVGHFA